MSKFLRFNSQIKYNVVVIWLKFNNTILSVFFCNSARIQSGQIRNFNTFKAFVMAVSHLTHIQREMNGWVQAYVVNPLQIRMDDFFRANLGRHNGFLFGHMNCWTIWFNWFAFERTYFPFFICITKEGGYYLRWMIQMGKKMLWYEWFGWCTNCMPKWSSVCFLLDAIPETRPVHSVLHEKWSRKVPKMFIH